MPNHPPTRCSTKHHASAPRITKSLEINPEGESQEIERKSDIKAETIDLTDDFTKTKAEPSIKAETIDLTSEPDAMVVKTERHPRSAKRKMSASKPLEIEEDDEEDLRLELRKIDIQQRLKKILKQRGRR